MEPFDLNQHFSALKERLRNVLNKHKANYEFKMSLSYAQTIDTSINSLQLQQEEFNSFVIRKQEDVNKMEPGIIKIKMQEHLNKTVLITTEHFNRLISDYQKMRNNN